MFTEVTPGMKNFRFEYSGEIDPDKKEKDVTRNLAKIFGVSEYEIEPFFLGNHIFIRNNLDEYTAKAYLHSFKKCGALGKVSLENTNSEKSHQNKQESTLQPRKDKDLTKDQPTPSFKTENGGCPKCGSNNINAEQCMDCGIYFEKYLKRLQEQVVTNSHSEIIDADDIDDQKFRHKATKWLVGASTLLTAVGIIDGFFQGNIVIGLGRVDLGYIPYIIAHLVLLRGCFLYAASKGYDSLYGLWGLLSFAGLSVLLLLPDKDERYNASSGKQKIFAGLCIGVCIYWLAQFFSTSSEGSHFYAQADLLATGRNEYPNTTLDAENTIYQQEHDELVTFIKNTLKLLEGDSYRSGQALKISGRMFHEVARYRIWRNYQKYLHATNQREFPDLLTFDEQKKLDNEISLLFKPLFRNIEPVGEAYQNWSSGLAMFHNANTFWDDFNKYQMHVYDRYKFYAFASREKLGENTPITLKDFKIPKHEKIITTKDDYTITFSTPMGPLAKTPVTMALYMYSYTYRGQPHETFEVDIISHQLPHRYIQSPFNEVGKFHAF
jgi:hypothetical protein